MTWLTRLPIPRATAVQAALSAELLNPETAKLKSEWTDMSYAPTNASTQDTQDIMQQLMQLLSGKQEDQPNQLGSALYNSPVGPKAPVGPSVEVRPIEVTRLAARFTDALQQLSDASPADALLKAYGSLVEDGSEDASSPPNLRANGKAHDEEIKKEEEAPLSVKKEEKKRNSFWPFGKKNEGNETPQKTKVAQQGAEPTVVDEKHPCLLLLGRAKEITSQAPLVIAHSLLGDHKGYGRLWSSALQRSDVFALRHRGLIGSAPFALDHDGANDMVEEYANALVAVFTSKPFDLIGASFGAVLASHVWRAAKAARGCPRRLILVDPPPAVPKELPMPKMLTSLRTAAMGVLLIYQRIEMGATVWEQFPQLKTLPEEALASFVTAQCLPAGASKEDLKEWSVRFERLLPLYRQCRHAFHMFSANIEAISRDADGSPAILMALSTERFPTFREMFPGIKHDVVDAYGPAATLRLPGKHIEMVNRCIGNQDADFTRAVESFLSDDFADAWWWTEHLEAPHMDAAEPQEQPNVNSLMPLLSALSASTAAPAHVEASKSCDIAVGPVAHRVAQELIGSDPSADAPLMEAGLDSLGAVEFRSRLSSQLGGVSLPETLIFDFPTLRQVEVHVGSLLASRTASHEHAPKAADNNVLHLLSSLMSSAALKPAAVMSLPASAPQTNSSTCVVGALSCKMSEGIGDISAAWHVGNAGYDVVSSVPSARWEGGDSLEFRVCYGAFVRNIDLFDQASFGLSPAEADVMDPHQRIALEEGYVALHAAGSTRGSLMNSSTGVFAGLWPTDHCSVLAKRGITSAYAVTGASAPCLVGRISYILGMQGPSISFDTACSASLAAFQGAMYALRHQESEGGLVFGVNFMCDSRTSELFAAAQMTSPSGKSHTFDARANGYARGEAISCAVLLPDLDDVRRVQCEASTVRQDGRSASLTAPNGNAQQALIRAALQSAGRTSQGGYVLESHGTGTSLGDPIEARAMVATRDDPQLMSVSGFKANVGHTEPTAGMSGMVQLLAAMRQSVGRPNAHLRIMNPHVRGAIGNITPSFVVQNLFVKRPAVDLVGGVSSFGLNGTIAHVVVSRHAAAEPSPSIALRSASYRRRAFAWSAVLKTGAQLSMPERIEASRRAERALDAVVATQMELPQKAEVVIVGAGLAGLTIAAEFANDGADLAVLEKTAVVGGTWRLYGNAYSRVNSSEPSYRLPLKKKQPMTNHSHHYQILTATLHAIKQHGLNKCIHTLTEIRSVALSDSGWVFQGRRFWPSSGEDTKSGFTLPCGFAVLATNRRLGSPRNMSIMGEHEFVTRGGATYRGISNDVKSMQCAGKRVVVLGFGPFAIESLRTSLELNAVHVTILGRRRGTVCPQIVDWSNLIQPKDAHFKNDPACDAIVLRHWQKAYDLSGAVRPECWKQGMLKPDGHSVSTSDVYYIAHHLKMADAQLGQAGRLEPGTLITQEEERLPCGVLIKCVGFELNEGNERLLGRAQMGKNGQVQDGLWLQVEGHPDAAQFESPFGSSYLGLAQLNAKLMLRYQRDRGLLQKLTFSRCRLNTLTFAQIAEGSAELSRGDSEKHALTSAIVADNATACNAMVEPMEYVKENAILWNATQRMLLRSSDNGAATWFP
jgi:3-oxoacyl-(acyl-carrier-protein) synthase/thioesterase domain-containing protein